MAKRKRSYRATPSSYIPWGKPDEVTVKREDTAVLLGQIRSITREVVYSSESSSTDTVTAEDKVVLHRRDTVKGQHQRSCDRPDVKALFFRGGRAYCLSCYLTRWGVHPLTDPKLESAPPGWRRMTRKERS